MKLDLNKSTETSRFVLALMLSTTTAVLVAAPFLIVMFRNNSGEPLVEQDVPDTSTEESRPLPSLGIDESEIGRIDESQEEEGSGPIRPQTPTRPATPAAPSTTEVPEVPATEPEETTVPGPESTETTAEPTTTTAEETTTTTIEDTVPDDTSVN